MFKDVLIFLFAKIKDTSSILYHFESLNRSTHKEMVFPISKYFCGSDLITKKRGLELCYNDSKLLSNKLNLTLLTISPKYKHTVVTYMKVNYALVFLL